MKRGWWKFTWESVDAENEITALNECDLEHIADCIKQGYVEGEIIQSDEED